MSDFGTQNLNKVSDYDDKSITEPKNQWKFFFEGLFQKKINPSVFEYIFNRVA
jgi:hypothetical protein